MQQISESEQILMKIIWKNGGTALYSQIMEELEKDHNEWKKNTVLTLLSRLVEKGYLQTGKTGGEYVEICDRKEAIAYAIDHGEPGDIIVLAGKGHEDYQEIKGVKYPMDERDLIRDILKERGWKEDLQTL